MYGQFGENFTVEGLGDDEVCIGDRYRIGTATFEVTQPTEPFGPAASQTPGIATTHGRPPHPPAGKPGDGPTIAFARSDLTIPWSSDYGTLLKLAESCDVPVRWSCRTGVCHTCETTLIAGNVDYSPDPG